MADALAAEWGFPRPKESDDDDDNIARWDDIRREHFGQVQKLVLTLSLASLGFAVSQIKDKPPDHWSAKMFFVLAMFTLVVSIVLGLFCMFNRLKDVRDTAKFLRDIKHKRLDEAGKTAWRAANHRLGGRTWRLLQWQIWSFGLGALCLITAFVIVFRHGLFR
jgi:hypothetical protein